MRIKLRIVRSLTLYASLLNSCAPKVMILQSPIISMEYTNSGSIRSFKDGKPTESKWCYGDEPVKEADDGSKHYGMIDQVVWKAHKKSAAKFFKDAKFYEQGGCVSMIAEAVKEGSTTTPSERIEKSEPTKPRNKNPMKKGKKA